MAEQSRRSPGRPKKAQEKTSDVAVAEAPKRQTIKWQEKKKSRMSAEEWVIASKKKPIAVIIKQKGVTVYDEEKNAIRSIRYCENENSIYVDEQSEFARVSPIVFREGRLIVRGNQPNLKAFLHAHPSNVENGGNTFRLSDPDKTVEEELASEFIEAEVVSMVRDKDIMDLIPVAIFFGVNTNSKSSSIRRELLRIAKSNPQNFINAFDSPQVQARAHVQQAIDFQIVNNRADGVYWSDSNQLIVSTPAGMDGVDVMSRFCLTDKGSLVYDRIKDELAKL